MIAQLLGDVNRSKKFAFQTKIAQDLNKWAMKVVKAVVRLSP